MTDDNPIVCSLDAEGLQRRLAAIAAVGADSLISTQVEGDCHLLRFRTNAATRKRLEEIVAAEAECCSFLDLSLHGEGDKLVLEIAAPQEAQALAGGIATAFLAASG